MHGPSTTPSAYPSFDLLDFARRWEKARAAGLRSALRESGVGEGEARTEMDLLHRVGSGDRDLPLRRVFDASRLLGLSLSRHLGVTLELSDLVELLPQLGIPCFRAPWRAHNSAYVLERPGCPSLDELGTLGCDYWREALDGFVVGVGDEERLARHRSRGHGDAECVDVLFQESAARPRVVSGGEAAAHHGTETADSGKHGPVAPEVRLALEPLRMRFEAMKIRLFLDGESEGILYYRLETDEGVLCGAGGKLLHDTFVRELALRAPRLVGRDAAPLAVYGGPT